MAETLKNIETKIDWETIRNQFPVLQQEVNGKSLVYLDNGASSQMPQSVIDRLNAYHSNEHANVHRGIHSLSQKATDAYEATYQSKRLHQCEFIGRSNFYNRYY